MKLNRVPAVDRGSGIRERAAVGMAILVVIIILMIAVAVILVGALSPSTTTSPKSVSTTSTSPSSQSTSSTSSTSTTSTTSNSLSSTASTPNIVSQQTTSVNSTSGTQVMTYQSIFLKSPGEGSPSYNTTAGEYGEALAVSGSFVIVGAPNETSDGKVGAGNAYIYDPTTGALLETLTSPTPQALGSFGWFLALSGDLAIVGAPGEGVNGMAGAGHVYIFNATTAKLLDTLTSPNAQARGGFGSDVAASGSLLVVGAAGENTTEGLAGRAYVFNATTGSLIGKLQSPNAQFEGEYGSTVYATPQFVFIAAQNETVGSSAGAGRVYVYSASTLSLVQTLVSPSPQKGGEFGFSLASTPSALIVGAPYEAVDGAPGVGNVYIFSTPSWSLEQTLGGPTQPQSEPPSFGSSVVAGYGYIAVSAPFNGTVVSSTEITGGAVYLYNETTFAPISALTAPSESSGYYSSTFGYSLAISPGSLLVGDPNAVELINSSPGYAFPGDAFIFELT